MKRTNYNTLEDITSFLRFIQYHEQIRHLEMEKKELYAFITLPEKFKQLVQDVWHVDYLLENSPSDDYKNTILQNITPENFARIVQSKFSCNYKSTKKTDFFSFLIRSENFNRFVKTGDLLELLIGFFPNQIDELYPLLIGSENFNQFVAHVKHLDFLLENFSNYPNCKDGILEKITSDHFISLLENINDFSDFTLCHKLFFYEEEKREALYFFILEPEKFNQFVDNFEHVNFLLNKFPNYRNDVFGSIISNNEFVCTSPNLNPYQNLDSYENERFECFTCLCDLFPEKAEELCSLIMTQKHLEQLVETDDGDDDLYNVASLIKRFPNTREEFKSILLELDGFKHWVGNEDGMKILLGLFPEHRDQIFKNIMSGPYLLDDFNCYFPKIDELFPEKIKKEALRAFIFDQENFNKLVTKVDNLVFLSKHFPEYRNKMLQDLTPDNFARIIIKPDPFANIDISESLGRISNSFHEFQEQIYSLIIKNTILTESDQEKACKACLSSPVNMAYTVGAISGLLEKARKDLKPIPPLPQDVCKNIVSFFSTTARSTGGRAAQVSKQCYAAAVAATQASKISTQPKR